MHQKTFAALIAVSCILASFSGLVTNSSFVWDDDLNLVRNDRLNPVSVKKIIAYWKAPFLRLYIPVTYTVWSAIAWTSRLCGLPTDGDGLDARVFHLFNLGVHAANVLLVLLILCKVQKNVMAAAIGAVLFGVHPLQVESVSYITELRTLLAFLFSFAAIYCHLKWQDPNDVGYGLRRTYVTGLALFTLALLAKPVSIVTPFFLMVLNWTLFGIRWKENLQRVFPWLLLVVPVVLVTTRVQPPERFQQVPELWQRILIAGDGAGFYLYKFFFPKYLCIDYGRTPEFVLSHGWGYTNWFFPLACLLTLFVLRRRLRGYLGCALIFFLGFAPMSGLVPFVFQSTSTVADRYVYFSVFGAALAVTLLLGRKRSSAFHAVSAAVCLSLLMTASHIQAGVWRSEKDLYLQALFVNPRSIIALNNIAAAYFHRTRYGVNLYHLALGVKPDYTLAVKNLTESLHYLKIHQPALSFAYLVRQGDEEEARQWFVKGTRSAMAQHWAPARRSLGKSLYLNLFDSQSLNNLGVVLIKTHEIDKATACLGMASAYHPRNAKLLNNYGVALFLEGRCREAISVLGEASARGAGDAVIRRNRLRLLSYAQESPRSQAPDDLLQTMWYRPSAGQPPRANISPRG